MSHDGAATYSLLRHPTINDALSLTHHTIFLGECMAPRSHGVDEESESSSDGHGNSSNNYYCNWKTIMVLDLIWNLAFAAVSVVVLFSASGEKPSTPLRIWLSGYSFQCLLHVGFVYFQYQKRSWDTDSDRYGCDHDQYRCSMMKRLESIHTMVSSIWWVTGFYWIVVGGQTLLQDSPRLYWLTVVFLAFDVFFIIFCIGMVLTIFFAVFCCIPVIAIAYAVAVRKGASEEDIRNLPQYRYCQDNRLRVLNNHKKQTLLGARLVSSNANIAGELDILSEDSGCCICLSRYVDGVELYSLPCKHHFHCDCITKWLRINATCPLCKFNIRRADTLV